jgi:putative transposase
MAEGTLASGVLAVKSRQADLDTFAENDPVRREALRRLAYVRRVLATPCLLWNAASLQPVIMAVSESLKDDASPSWHTVRRWVRAYESGGCDVRTLLPQQRTQGNRWQKVSGKRLVRYDETDYEKARTVTAFLEQAIPTHYLQRQRVTVRFVYEQLETRILEENRCRAAHDQLPVPHPSTVYRHIAALDPYECAQARYGTKYAQALYQVNPNAPAVKCAAHLLGRVEGDHTRLDLLVVDEKTRLPLGRPWLTALLDVCTRMVLGIYVSFAAPGYTSVMLALRHAVRPKDYLKERYPKLQYDWPAHGVPERLIVDNGKEFHSRHLTDTCVQLGIELEHAPPQCGWYKGALERWFGTQNTKLLHELPGTTFSNVTQRGDYDPQRHAVITLPALEELIHTWIVDLYHQQVQRGLGAVPYQCWQNAVQAQPLPHCARLADLDILTGCRVERRIGRAGIELFALHYHAAALARIRCALPAEGKAQIKYDPTDLSVIYVFDPTTQGYVPVAATEHEYARGLTLHQHEIIRRHARQTATASVDAAALSEARQHITAIMTREREAAPTLTKRTRAARFLNAGQPNEAAHLEPITISVGDVSAAPTSSSASNATNADSNFLPETEGWSVSYDLTAWREEASCQ